MDFQDIDSVGGANSSVIPEDYVEVITFTSPRLKEVSSNVKGSTEDVKERLKELSQKEFGNARENAIYTTALGYGASSALYYDQYKYTSSIELYGDSLDKIFNFKPLMLADGRVAPAIVLEANENVIVKNDRTIQTVKNSYYIFKDLRVATKVPSWRDYLISHFNKPKMPDVYIVPTTEEELEYWKKGASKGWEKGLQQSKRIIIENMRKLERDYEGAIRFHILKDSGILKIPMFSTSNSEIAMKDGVINIGQKEFKIEVMPKFNENSKGWKFLPRLDNLIK